MKPYLLKTDLQILLFIFTVLSTLSSCTNEEVEKFSGSLPGAIDLQVSLGNFDVPSASTRAETSVISSQTVELAEQLYAQVIVSEEDGPATRATTDNVLTENMKFRIQAYEDDILKTSILYQVLGEGAVSIIDGQNYDIEPEYGYIETGGHKFFRLVPGKSYKLVGYTDGTENDPGAVSGNLFTYTWRKNYMQFVKDNVTINNGDNALAAVFKHMNAAIQVIVNTDDLSGNVENAQAVIWQESSMPYMNSWDFLSCSFTDTPLTVDGSTDNGVLIDWDNVAAATMFKSNLSYFVPGEYGALKIKFNSIRVNGSDFSNTNTISLSSNTFNTLSRNKKYVVTIKFIPPAKLEYNQVDLYWGNDDTNGDGIVDVNGTNYVFNVLNQITANKSDLWLRLPEGMYWAGNSGLKVNETPVIIKVAEGTTVDITVQMSPSLRGRSVDVTVHTTLADAIAGVQAKQIVPVAWYNRLGHLAQKVGSEENKQYSYSKYVKGESAGTNTSLSFSNDKGYVAIGKNPARPEVNAVLTKVLPTREGIFYCEEQDKQGNTKKTKVYVQQNTLGFVASGIFVRDGKYVITEDGKKEERVFFMPGCDVGIQGYSTNSSFSAEGVTWQAWRPVDYYYTVDSVGNLTAHSGLSLADFRKGVNIDHRGDPCSKVSPMYSYRYATASEIDYLIKGATHSTKYMTRIYMPVLKQYLYSEGAWRISMNSQKTNGCLSEVSARWSGKGCAIDGYAGSVIRQNSFYHAARALCVRN